MSDFSLFALKAEKLLESAALAAKKRFLLWIICCASLTRKMTDLRRMDGSSDLKSACCYG